MPNYDKSYSSQPVCMGDSLNEGQVKLTTNEDTSVQPKLDYREFMYSLMSQNLSCPCYFLAGKNQLMSQLR